MEHNTPLNPQQPSSPQHPHPSKDALLRKIRIFLQQNIPNNPQQVKCLRGGFGFALLHVNTPAGSIDQLVQQGFDCNLEQLAREAHRCDFRTKVVSKGNAGKEMTVFLAKQKIVEPTQQHGQLSAPSSSEQEDQFPKEEEIEAVLKEKQQKQKSDFVKPSIILNKAQSEGHAGIPSSIKKEDVSIEVKLQEHQSPYIPPLDSDRKRVGQVSNQSVGESFPLDISDRLKLEKINYERCSKLIDGTIIQLLEAQRGRRIDERREGLMERVAEIYDLLSNSIENGGQVIRMAGQKEGLKQEQKVEDQ